MPKSYATPAEYLASLPDDRRRALAAVRKTIRANLGKGFKAVSYTHLTLPTKA